MRSQTVVDRRTTSVRTVENSIIVPVRSNRIDLYTLAKWHSNAIHARRNFGIKGISLLAEPNQNFQVFQQEKLIYYIFSSIIYLLCAKPSFKWNF